MSGTPRSGKGEGGVGREGRGTSVDRTWECKCDILIVHGCDRARAGASVLK